MVVTTVTTVTRAGEAGGGAMLRRALRRLAVVTAVTVVTVVTAVAAEKPFAAPQTPEAVSPTSPGSLLQVTFSLLLVLGAVFAAAWLVRKLKGFGRFGNGPIQIVADTALGPKERAVIVQVGEQQLLLGVTAQQVSLLHVLDRPVAGPLPNPPPQSEGGVQTDFAAILRRSLGLK